MPWIRIMRRGLCKTVTLPDGDSLQYRPWDTELTPLQLALAGGTAGWRCWSRVRSDQ
jgi:hypothetical protein